MKHSKHLALETGVGDRKGRFGWGRPVKEKFVDEAWSFVENILKIMILRVIQAVILPSVVFGGIGVG